MKVAPFPQCKFQSEPLQASADEPRLLEIKSVVQKKISIYAKSHHLKIDHNEVAAIFLIDDENEFHLISIGTGNKCVSAKTMLKGRDEPGEAVLDTHAVVVARRGFVSYLYQNIQCLMNGKNDKRFLLETACENTEIKQFRRKKGYKLELFMNVLPCGDAEEYLYDSKDYEDNVLMKKTKDGVFSMPDNFTQTFKVVKSLDCTFFNSCSDKMLKWNFVGLQGGLLENLIGPIYFDQINISKKIKKESLKSALFGRIDKPELVQSSELCGSNYQLHRPRICFIKSDAIENLTSNLPEQLVDVSLNMQSSVNGDTDFEEINPETGRISGSEDISRLSKKRLMDRYFKLMHNFPELSSSHHNYSYEGVDSIFEPYYLGLKKRSIHYQNAKRAFTDACRKLNMGQWIRTPTDLSLLLISDDGSFPI